MKSLATQPNDATLAPVEMLRLSTHYVLHNQLSGAVVLANAHAAEIWTKLQYGRIADDTIDALAQSWGIDRSETRKRVSAVFDDWQRAGLFSTPKASVSASPAPRPSTDWQWSGWFQIGEAVVRVESEDPLMGNVLHRVLYTLNSEAPATATVSVFLRGDEYWVSNRGAHHGPYDFSGGRHMALRDVICAARPTDDTSAVFHAGAVQVKDRAILIAGDTGSGKSTLIAGLVLSGCPYITDDLVGLDRHSTRVRPFHVAISLKPGSYSILRDLIAEQGDLQVSEPDHFGLRYLNATPRASATSERAVSHLIFPKYQAESAKLEVRSISPLEALQRFLATGTRVAGSTLTMAPLVKLLNETPALDLTYADWQEAAAFLTDDPPA